MVVSHLYRNKLGFALYQWLRSLMLRFLSSWQRQEECTQACTYVRYCDIEMTAVRASYIFLGQQETGCAMD